MEKQIREKPAVIVLTLEANLDEAEIQAILTAVHALRGVAGAQTTTLPFDAAWAREAARQELTGKILRVLTGISPA